MFLSALLALSLTTQQVCPAEIHTEQKAAAPLGWRAVPGGHRHTLNGFILYLGDPSNKFELPPHRTRTLNGRQYTQYKVPSDMRELWIDCGYFGTSVEMRKNLGRGISRCDAVSGLGKSSVDSIECR
jgi:hypothetical protein